MQPPPLRASFQNQEAPTCQKCSAGHGLSPFCPQVDSHAALGAQESSLKTRRVGRASAGPAWTALRAPPSWTLPLGSAQTLALRDHQSLSSSHPRESLSLHPTQPRGLGFCEVGLSFYKMQKELLASSCFGFLPGEKEKSLRQRKYKELGICWGLDEGDTRSKVKTDGRSPQTVSSHVL